MNTGNSKPYPLDERTFLFAKQVGILCKELPRDFVTIEYTRQLIRSSASVGANYIEANESLGKKDFAMRIKICRKEAKESEYWMRLILESTCMNYHEQLTLLMNEANELKKIFSAILSKAQV
jgi:four helix bundle protein